MEHFVTSSDIGGVRVGGSDYMCVFPNGYGDGATNVVVCDTYEDGAACDHLEDIKFLTSFEVMRCDCVHVMRYDCGENYLSDCKLRTGRYFVYQNCGNREHGLVVFERQNEKGGLVQNANAEMVSFSDAVKLMDEELREIAYNRNDNIQAIFDDYCMLHYERYGEDFPPNKWPDGED
jgi:hypothetical protein